MELWAAYALHMKFMRCAVLWMGATAAAMAQSTVPVVSCPSDGQQGPQPAAAGSSRDFALAPALAEKLAYYQGPDGPGVFAPRGWHCLQIEGSNGTNLIVAPRPLSFAAIVLKKRGVSGPGVQLSVMSGSTSGRFAVARVVARVFPEHRDFVQKVLAEKLEPAASFPFGRFPADKLHYLSDHAVEYVTPGGKTGLGTSSWLGKNATPIRGFATFDPTGDNDLSQLSVRIPGAPPAMLDAIVMQAEFDTATR